MVPGTLRKICISIGCIVAILIGITIITMSIGMISLLMYLFRTGNRWSEYRYILAMISVSDVLLILQFIFLLLILYGLIRGVQRFKECIAPALLCFVTDTAIYIISLINYGYTLRDNNARLIAVKDIAITVLMPCFLFLSWKYFKLTKTQLPTVSPSNNEPQLHPVNDWSGIEKPEDSNRSFNDGQGGTEMNVMPDAMCPGQEAKIPQSYYPSLHDIEKEPSNSYKIIL